MADDLNRLKTKVAALERWAKKMVTWGKKVERKVKELDPHPGTEPPKPPSYPA